MTTFQKLIILMLFIFSASISYSFYLYAQNNRFDAIPVSRFDMYGKQQSDRINVLDKRTGDINYK
jgi:uncharacterized protein YdaL